jgi:hypothetical protein
MTPHAPGVASAPRRKLAFDIAALGVGDGFCVSKKEKMAHGRRLTSTTPKSECA